MMANAPAAPQRLAATGGSMPLKLNDALLNLSCKIAEKLPHAAGLALAFAYCAASGQQIPAFVVGALAGDVVVKGVESSPSSMNR